MVERFDQLWILTNPCRSKHDTLLFIKGAGVSDSLIADIWQRFRDDASAINKYEIVRTALSRLNERGDTELQRRREVVKRVVEFDDFTTCWPNDRLKAQGLVSQIQKLVKVKDSFTRMQLERDRERSQHMAMREKEVEQLVQKNAAIDSLKSELFGLFSSSNPQRRGKALESILNRLFAIYGISVKDDFTVCDDEGAGVVEQIDGVIELDAHLHFVEMKWWGKPVGVNEIASHMMRVFLRAEGRAIIISASDFTAPAIVACKKALTQKVVTLCTLEELVKLLEKRADLISFLRNKVSSTMLYSDPFPKVVDFD